MPIILDQALYNRVKREADRIYEKPSAYKSGWIVKTYKSRGGRYEDDDKSKNLKRWFKEDWKSIGKEGEYPTYRPTKRISKDTPLTADEIDPKQAKEQIALKQDIKGKSNLPKFKGKGLDQYDSKSDYVKSVEKSLKKHYGKSVKLYESTRNNKKFMVENPDGKYVHFGAKGYEDWHNHKDPIRQERFRKRNARWEKADIWSPAHLAYWVLWD